MDTLWISGAGFALAAVVFLGRGVVCEALTHEESVGFLVSAEEVACPRVGAAVDDVRGAIQKRDSHAEDVLRHGVGPLSGLLAVRPEQCTRGAPMH